MNKIKKIYTIALLMTSMLATSCSDWLNVAPSNQVNGDKLFEIGDGYRNALNGVYLNLGTSSLYGQTLSWGFLDVIAQSYQANTSEMQATSAYYKAANYMFDDSDVKDFISSIWSQGYNNIANCNNLIRNVSEANSSVFMEGEMEKNLIWGEALGLRALIHFDMLRMFAPSTLKDDGKPYLPYVEVYPTLVPTYESNKGILEKVVRDLKAAKALVATCDMADERKGWMSTENRMLAAPSSDSPTDVFFAYRGYRMNYYAISAMLARVYCWAGEYELAYKEAEEVVKATYPNGSSSTALCFGFSVTLPTNPKDYNSIIMSFFHATLQEKYAPYISKDNSAVFVVNATALFNGESTDKRTELFGDWDGGDIKYSTKYDIKKGTNGTDMIPAIRLSEMYYIMGEYFAQNGGFSKAGEMLDKVRYARGISTTNLASVISSLEVFHTHLLGEMRREFLGEGQLFFQYKRLDKKPKDNVIFVFDKPDNEDI